MRTAPVVISIISLISCLACIDGGGADGSSTDGEDSTTGDGDACFALARIGG